MPRTLRLITLALASTIVATPVALAEHAKGMSETVSFSDLKLNTPAGDKTLLERINNAAVRVCGGYPNIVDLDATEVFATCRHTAIANAVAAVRDPDVLRELALEVGAPD